MTNKNVDNMESISQQARVWVAQLGDTNVNPSDKKRIEAQLALSPSHRDAFNRNQKIWKKMNQMGDFAKQHPEQIPTELSSLIHNYAEIKPEPKNWDLFKPLAIAAVLLVCISVLWPLLPNNPTSVHYQTARGEQQTITLSDNSVIELNSQSRVIVRYTETKRDIVLQSGEVFFNVAHNTKRPFVVYAGEASTRAVGTSFNIYKQLDNQVEVIVVEGKVEVSQYLSAEKTPWQQQLSAGEKIDYQQQPSNVKRLSKQEIKSSTAWRHQQLNFDNTPLDELIEELNQYRTQQIVIKDDKLMKLHFGGVFSINETDLVLAALQRSFAITITEVSPTVIHLYARDNITP